MMRYVKLLASAAMLLAGACTRQVEIGERGGEGYLLFENVSCRLTATRGGGIATEDFTVALYCVEDGRESLVESWRVGDATGPKRLTVGSYFVEVSSPRADTPGFESRRFVGRTGVFSIARNIVTRQSVVCRLASTMVTVRYSAALKARMDNLAAVRTVVTIGGGTFEFAAGEERAVYFNFEGAQAVAEVKFIGSVDGIPIEQTESLRVERGEWARIRLSADEDNGGLQITLFGSEAGQIGDGDGWF